MTKPPSTMIILGTSDKIKATICTKSGFAFGVSNMPERITTGMDDRIGKRKTPIP